MATIETIMPGSFCWLELATTDQPGAKQFYSSLFGWTATDFPMGPDGDYTIFQLNGRDNGGAFTITKEMRERGVPPHWQIYIAVSNVDDSTKKAAELGANILRGPFDVMDKGRMAIIKDPTGAPVCLWQTKTSTGLGTIGEPGALVWADLLVQDRATAKKFYSELLGWEFVTGEGKDDSGYWHIVNGGKGIGGMPPKQFVQPGTTPHWSIYYQSADCDATYAKATALGATTIVPPMTIEGTGKMAVIADPQGASFALFQPLR